MRREQIFTPLILALVAAIGMILGYKMHEANSADLVQQYTDDELSSVEESLRLIRANYYGDIDTASYVNNILSKAVETLDPYSSYVPPQGLAGFHHAISNKYVGYGFDFITYRDSLVVTEVVVGSPAEGAGLNRGDVIVGLNGNQLTDPSEIVDGLFQSESTSLMLYRPSENKTKTVSMNKGPVETSAVQAKLIDQGRIGYLKIKRFTDDVFLDFMEQFDYYKSHGLEFKDVIIDLRDNPGGLLDETVKILNQIIREPNQTIVSTINNKGKQKDYKSNGRSFLKIENVVVLINEHSASASEIMAGSLQDLGVATIVGTNSYGKGKIQQHFSVDNGGSLNLTIGEYLLPSGRRIISDTSDIAGRGVVPDVAITNICDSSEDQRMLDQYSYLIERRKLDADVLTATEISQLIADYSLQDETLNAECTTDRTRKLAALLWHEYQSELDLNEDLIQYDHALSQAIKILSE